MSRLGRAAQVSAGAAFAWLLCACVTVPEFRALEREVAGLKSRGRPDAPADAARLADLGAGLDRLEREVAELRGQLEEADRNATLAREELAEVRELLGGVRETPVASRSAPGPRLAAPAVPGGRASEELRAYETAFRFYRAADYEAAIDHFGNFLQNYPASDYADNALFWKGECYLKRDDYERAVLTFEDVTKRYPKGNKAPDALYRQAVAILEIGRRTQQEDTYAAAAREIFEKIVRDYPESDRVPEARRQLEKLSS